MDRKVSFTVRLYDGFVAVVALIRHRPGYYTSEDGEFEVIQGDGGCAWDGEWIVRSTTNRYSYSDPMPTMRECLEHIGQVQREQREAARASR